MKINVENIAKLTAAIEKFQPARASVRTITAESVQTEIGRIQNRLDNMLTRKDQTGLSIIVDLHAQAFPAAYRGIPESTYFEAIRTASGWFVTRIYRTRTASPTMGVQIDLISKAAELAAFAAKSF